MRPAVLISRVLALLLPAAALISAVFALAGHPSWGAVACAKAGSAPGAAGCVKGAPKVAPVLPAPVPAPVSDEPPPGAWKEVLDPLKDGGWTFLTDGPPENPSAVFASSHSVLHNGNVVTAWIRWEFQRPQAEVYPLHYQSAVTREELDCDARSYRRAQVFYYMRNNLREKGPSFTALNDDTNWKQAIPGSEPDAMLNWACKAPVVHHAHAASKEDKDDKAEAADEAAAAKASSAPAAASSGPSPVPLSGPSSVSTGR